MSAVMPERDASVMGRQGTVPPASGAVAAAPAPWPAPAEPPLVPPKPAVKPVEPGTESAADRLERSRARLRSALLEIAHPLQRPKSTVGSSFADVGARARAWLQSIPGTTLLVESVESWWRHHPLRVAGAVAKEASEGVVAPYARRNPYLFIFGAAVVGAAFAATRPWRWLLRPALFMGLVPQIASHAMRRLPVESWLRMLTEVTGTRTPRSAARNPDPASAPPGKAL